MVRYGKGESGQEAGTGGGRQKRNTGADDIGIKFEELTEAVGDSTR
jgi:hypothetical protein